MRGTFSMRIFPIPARLPYSFSHPPPPPHPPPPCEPQKLPGECWTSGEVGTKIDAPGNEYKNENLNRCARH